mmetsp:Transcript_33258/g.66170  ORF Transcript_33258/g.66170 Transcript_33258/m.66170 type:complete len:234 (+) Transcript_33258:918-1619(+)
MACMPRMKTSYRASNVVTPPRDCWLKLTSCLSPLGSTTLTVKAPSGRMARLPKASRICGRTMTDSPAAMTVASVCICLPCLSTVRASLVHPSTSERAAVALPATTCSPNGEPGKATRSPLPLVSHHTCSSNVPAFCAMYVIWYSPRSRSIHDPSNGQPLVAGVSFSFSLSMERPNLNLSFGTAVFEYSSKKLMRIGVGSPATAVLRPAPWRLDLTRSGSDEISLMKLGEPTTC